MSDGETNEAVRKTARKRAAKKTAKKAAKKTARKAASKRSSAAGAGVVTSRTTTDNSSDSADTVSEAPLRKAPTKVQAMRASVKERQRRWMVVGGILVVGFGASVGIGFSDSGQIDIKRAIDERNERIRSGDLTGADTERSTVEAPVQRTAVQQRTNSGLRGAGSSAQPRPEPEPNPVATSTATSSDSGVATSTEATTDTEGEIEVEAESDVATTSPSTGTSSSANTAS